MDTRATRAWDRSGSVPGLDQMTEHDLLDELHRLADACERLNLEITNHLGEHGFVLMPADPSDSSIFRQKDMLEVSGFRAREAI
jgi:hypothetical protein